MRSFLPIFLLFTLAGRTSAAPSEGDYVIRNFKFTDGESLDNLKIHYTTFGSPVKDGSGMTLNAVLIMHGTTGSGHQFTIPEFSGVLFGPGDLLDTTKCYIILPDDIGHGKSSQPKDGLHARFPHYGYRDMVEAEYQLVSAGLGVNHLRLVMGTSMGGMHTWLWGEIHPEFMDALMPLASLPTQISGRNRVWRRMIIDAIRNDPEWKNGDYTTQPQSLRVAAEMLFFMSSNPTVRQKEMPTLAMSDTILDRFVTNYVKLADANDVLYAIEASQDYVPGPDLEKIKAPLLAVNSEDDLINPPELRILEKEIKRVPHGQFVIIPFSERTRGHGTHTLAAVWKQYLVKLLKESTR
jgi:homoserine O-acetyltransferase/O-succinyltransferase